MSIKHFGFVLWLVPGKYMEVKSKKKKDFVVRSGLLTKVSHKLLIKCFTKASRDLVTNTKSLYCSL